MSTKKKLDKRGKLMSESEEYESQALMLVGCSSASGSADTKAVCYAVLAVLAAIRELEFSLLARDDDTIQT